MVRRIGLLFVLLLALSDGCAAWQKVVWPAFVTCGAPASAELVKQVEIIIATGGTAQELSADAVAALEKLAASYGPEVIACVLGQLIDAWLAPTGERAAPTQLAAAARAQGFLNDKGTTVRTQ